MKQELVLLGTRVSPEMHLAWRMIAAKNNNSMAEELRLLVEKKVKQFEKEVVQAA